MEVGQMQYGKRGRRVVVLGSYGPSLINFRGPLIAALVDRGYETFALASDIDDETAQKVRALGAEPVPVVLGRTSLNPIKTWKSGRQLRLLLRQIKPEVMIAYTIKPVVLGAAAAKTAGVGHFVAMITGMGYPFLGGLHPKRVLIRLVAMLMYKRALASSSFVVFQNEDDRSDFRRLRLLPRALPSGVVNGSGVDLKHFQPHPLPADISFLMIARFLRDKGIMEYGKASAKLKKQFPHVRFSLVGWIDESPDSIDKAELDAIIASGIDYVGHLTDVRSAIAECSVYVLPSYREGTPRSVLEAMAMGRAIVTTDAPGCRETVIDAENGYLVPPRDADALFRAMLRFIEEPALAVRMGVASRRLVEERYDVHKVNADILRYAQL